MKDTHALAVGAGEPDNAAAPKVPTRLGGHHTGDRLKVLRPRPQQGEVSTDPVRIRRRHVDRCVERVRPGRLHTEHVGMGGHDGINAAQRRHGRDDGPVNVGRDIDQHVAARGERQLRLLADAGAPVLDEPPQVRLPFDQFDPGAVGRLLLR
ncbi:MAG: hypothetical protein L0G99_16440 [Propionibacteriales bacterium]|nr:hypothetical protein [Propionibacteriales bacterium]